jgi:DNA-binding beta-propeller fold protein YncE
MHPMRPTSLARLTLQNVACVTTALGVALALLPSGAGAAVAIRYEGALNLTRHQDGRLLPAAVTCDPLGGGLVVTDAAQGALHVFNRAGIETFRTTGYSGLTQPVDGAIDHAGRLIGVTMVNGARPTLARLDVYGEPDGWTAAAPIADWQPDHVMVAHDGNYVTIDGTAGLLAKHDAASGQVLWSAVIAEPASLDLEMGLSRPVQLADGTYVVCGSNLHRVILAGEGGEVISTFGRFGSSPGRMVAPVAVAAGPDGSILVLDQMRHKVVAFDAQGAFISEYGSVGDAPGAFYYPVSIATDGSGHLYVAQGYRGRVQVFSVLADGTVE